MDGPLLSEILNYASVRILTMPVPSPKIKEGDANTTHEVSLNTNQPLALVHYSPVHSRLQDSVLIL